MPKLPPPLSGPPPEEVHLKNAPLAQVICQVRFAPVLALGQPSGIVGFQESVRADYPLLEQDGQQHIAVSQNGTLSVRDEVIWRFCDLAREWRVSLATDFVALETKTYKTRRDFRNRLSTILLAIEKNVALREASRIGVRYVNQLAGESADNAATLFAPGALGVYRRSYGPFTEHLVTEIGLRCEEGRVRARTAYIPAGTTMDQSVDPIDEDSWVLDLDVFTDEAVSFSANAISNIAGSLAERAYAVFREMVSDEFLSRFRGDA